MAIIDAKKNIIKGKIVYYGPGLCGKTTNLEHINRVSTGSEEMMSLATEGDRTIFFDFLPMDLGKIRGISTKFKLYTVPGQVRYNLTRKMVLKNVDGVVFVADSQLVMMDSNIESLENLFDNLRELKLNPDDIPIVLQYNKRDLPNLASSEDLDASLNANNYKVFLASAVSGEGVLDTLKGITKLVFQNMMATFEGKGGKAAKAREATAPQPVIKEPATRKQKTRKVKNTRIGAKSRERETTIPDLYPPPRSKPPGAQAKEEPGVAVAAPTVEDAKARTETVTDPATRRDIEDLRTEIASLARTQDMALDAQDRASKTREKQNRGLQRSVTEAVSGIREDIAKSQEGLDELRKAVTGIEERLAAAPPPGAGLEDLQKEHERLLGEFQKGPDIKKELSDLRQSVEGLAGQADGVLATQAMVSVLDRKMAALLKQVEAQGELVKRVEAQAQEHQRSHSRAIAGIREEIAMSRKAGPGPVPERAPARRQAPVHRKVPAQTEVLEKDPRQQYASRVARVMVADLGLYYPEEVTEGIRKGDLHERLKEQMENMRTTYETRVPEDVRMKKDHLEEVLARFVTEKRKQLGIA